jgi:predicted MFS family arabinose efflux permease
MVSRNVLMLCTATLLCMSVWFSASFVVEDFTATWHLGPAQAALLTVSVQVGFVLGALASAALSLADRWPARRLMPVAGMLAATVNLLLLVPLDFTGVVAVRALTGALLAGIYPVAVKAVSHLVQPARRGVATGAMIAALTVGSAFPHAVVAVGPSDWRVAITTSSAATAAGALLAMLISTPAAQAVQPPVPWKAVGAALRRRSVQCANLGYAAHMWELYALWAWIGVILTSRAHAAGRPPEEGSAWAFVVIGVGAAGCLVGGWIGDRRSKAFAAGLALMASGTAAVLFSLSAGWPFPLVVAIACFWGFWVIADSGQFSALIADHVEPAALGRVLTIQMAIGYAVTTISITAVPLIAEHTSWESAVLILALGPVIGVMAMIATHRHSQPAAPWPPPDRRPGTPSRPLAHHRTPSAHPTRPTPSPAFHPAGDH